MKIIYFIFNLSALLFINLNTSAQKLPNIQETSLRAPANINIDGKATEWDNKFLAYNKNINVYYTIANDDKNLYLAVYAPDPALINKILGSGVKFTINKSGKKDFKGGVSITYPVFENGKGIYINFTAPGSVIPGGKTPHMQTDSFVVMNNNRLAERAKFIMVQGIKGMDTLVSIYNREGFKAVSLFDQEMAYTYEMAIDLKRLGIDAGGLEKFAYNIKLPGFPVKNKKGEILNINWTPPANPVRTPANPNGYMIMLSTDFWGEYTLAKK